MEILLRLKFRTRSEWTPQKEFSPIFGTFDPICRKINFCNSAFTSQARIIKLILGYMCAIRGYLRLKAFHS